jgi:hypothetical protein
MRIQKAFLATLALAVTAVTPAEANADRDACERVKQQIREIEARMRDGYSAAQGIRLEARLRKLKEKRYKLCR